MHWLENGFFVELNKANYSWIECWTKLTVGQKAERELNKSLDKLGKIKLWTNSNTFCMLHGTFGEQGLHQSDNSSLLTTLCPTYD